MKSLFERITGPMDPEFTGVRFPEPDLFSPSELYHEASKLHKSASASVGARIEMFLAHDALQAAAAHPHKAYSGYQTIELPSPTVLNTTVSDVLLARHSIRHYSARRATPLATFSNWLGWACGTVTRGDGGQPGRTYPSGGGLYPLEVYVAVRAVDALSPGVYHYNAIRHSLDAIGDADAGSQVFNNLTQEDAATSAHFAVMVTAVFMRSQYKYGERGYRFILLEAGHMMQNLSLLAPAVGLGMVALGGFYDDKLHDLLALNGVDEAVLYAAAGGLLDQ